MFASRAEELRIGEAIPTPPSCDSGPSITFTRPEGPRESPSQPASLSPFADPIEAITPISTRSPAAISVVSFAQANIRNRYFHSRRIKDPKEIQKPWLEKKDPREKWVTIIPLMGIAIGLGIAAFLVFNGISSVVNHKYCEVFVEDWSQGFREDIWTREVEVGGFG